MQKATNYMRGTVRLEAEGPYPERFFNICSAWGIRFWGVERVDETTVRVTVTLSQAKQARSLGPKCLCEVRQVGEAGAPRFLMGFRDRYGMITGLILSLLAVLILSRFVLVIDIVGETAIPEGLLLSALRESGLYPGVYGPAVDERSVANRMLLDLDELGFLSVNLRGIRAEVVVRDAAPVPEVEPTGVASDLVAAKAGRIVVVLPMAGQSVVTEEDWVEAGDTLISGTVTVTAGEDDAVRNCYPVVAKGQVWAEVEEELSAAFPLTQWKKVYSGGEKSLFEVVILGKRFKISPKMFQPFADYDKITNTRSLTLGEITLPVSWVTTRCKEYSLVSVEASPSAAEDYLRGILQERLERTVGKAGQIMEAHWQTRVKDGVLTVTVTAKCREQIAVRETEEYGAQTRQ